MHSVYSRVWWSHLGGHRGGGRFLQRKHLEPKQQLPTSAGRLHLGRHQEFNDLDSSEARTGLGEDPSDGVKLVDHRAAHTPPSSCQGSPVPWQSRGSFSQGPSMQQPWSGAPADPPHTHTACGEKTSVLLEAAGVLGLLVTQHSTTQLGPADSEARGQVRVCAGPERPLGPTALPLWAGGTACVCARGAQAGGSQKLGRDSPCLRLRAPGLHPGGTGALG